MPWRTTHGDSATLLPSPRSAFSKQFELNLFPVGRAAGSSTCLPSRRVESIFSYMAVALRSPSHMSHVDLEAQ